MASSTQHPHFVLFPFMSKGHTIPLLHLAQLLLRHGVTLTIFTTKANRPFITHFLHRHADSISIIDLPFPSDIEGIPQGIESTDKLPSMSLFWSFLEATKLMQPHFEHAINNLSGHVTCIVSDGFLSWTLASANKLRIPRLSFFGMAGYSTAVALEVGLNHLFSGPESDDDLITLTTFPWIKVTRNDFDKPFNQPNPSGRQVDLLMEVVVAIANSHGLIMNSFYELEPLFIDYLNREYSTFKAWCVGPFCMAESPSPAPISGNGQKPEWIEWLDEKLSEGRSVLYVAFGSQVEFSTPQLKAISKGLEDSEVSFLWVVKSHVVDEVQERVGERGIIVHEWVDQREILKHESVKGFVSHCGLNSVMESICSEVPILAWPMMADQHLNARMVVEEIKVGLRVETVDGSVRGFVKSEGLKKMVKELMEGERGKEVRKKVMEVGKAAKVAMAEGGSSWRTMDELIDDVSTVGKVNK